MRETPIALDTTINTDEKWLKMEDPSMSLVPD